MSSNSYHDQFDITWLIEAGLYEIINLSTLKRYIGHTENILERFGKHVSALNDCVHDCQQLQEDWTTRSNDFVFRVLQIGVEWRDKQKRVETEKELISTYNPEQLYNARGLYIEEHHMYRCEIRVRGVIYSSMSEARKALSMSETTLRRRLRSPKFPEFETLKITRHGYRKVSVDGKNYPTVNSLVEVGLVVTRQQAIYRLKSPLKQWVNWQYDDSENEIDECKSNDYPERE